MPAVSSSNRSSTRPTAVAVDPNATPDLAAMLADEVRRLLEMLPDQELRKIAVARMEGYTNREIASRLGCTERTVERRLRYIRVIWDGSIRQHSDKATEAAPSRKPCVHGGP